MRSNTLAIVAIAVGLSMDALAVSVANGFMIRQLRFRHAFRIAFFFGFFQFFMPIIGWAAGRYFNPFIGGFDHWIAFGLLLFTGVKMIVESRSLDPACESRSCVHFPTLLLMSVATSIDALAVGISFAVLEVGILEPVLIIGALTFVVCIAGIYVGNRIGHLFENALEIAGGVIIIGTGIKILLEHLLA
jgi:manganese efflux pump family protein